ncbi:MAG: hypothetical protein WA118_03795 [Carboxydocellales bacterium]
MTRLVEAYIGEYASGKSENAINRAIELASQGRTVTLVDLDLVEPFYTLRPIQAELRELGIYVVAWETRDTIGLGEAGNILKPEMKWVLRREGDIIMDIGYGIEGAKTLNLVEGAFTDPDLKIFAIINVSRPMTFSIPDIVEHVQEMGKIHGLLNNTHLGDDTTPEVIEAGAEVVAEAARQLNLPVVATAVDERLASSFPGGVDHLGHPVRLLRRFMPKAFW